MTDPQARHEGEAEAGRRHRDDPIVALTFVDGRPIHLELVEDATGRQPELAIDARQIALPVQLLTCTQVPAANRRPGCITTMYCSR